MGFPETANFCLPETIHLPHTAALSSSPRALAITHTRDLALPYFPRQGIRSIIEIEADVGNIRS
jgi:hypothetical protein